MSQSLYPNSDRFPPNRTGLANEIVEFLNPMMASRDEIYHILRSLWLFKEIDLDEIEIVAGLARAATYEEKETIAKTSDVESGFFVSLQGRVSVMKPAGVLNKKEIAVIEPGQIFGEMVLFDNYVRSAELVAKEKVSALFFPKKDFLKCVEDHPRIGVKLLLKIGKRLSDAIWTTNDSYLDALMKSEKAKKTF